MTPEQMTPEQRIEGIAAELIPILRRRGCRKAHTTLWYSEGKTASGWLVGARQNRAGFREVDFGMVVETEEEFNALKAAMGIAVTRLP